MSDQRQTFTPRLVPAEVSQTPDQPAYMAMPVDEHGCPLLPPGMMAGLLVENVKATWIGTLPGDGEDVPRAALFALDDEFRSFVIAIVEAPCFVNFLPLN